jgi:peroxiredoxin
MEALHKEFDGQGLAVVAIDFQETATEVRSFYEEHLLSFPALLDPDAKVFGLYQTWSLPTTFVVNKCGYIVGKASGYRDWHTDESKAFFTQLLKEFAWCP